MGSLRVVPFCHRWLQITVEVQGSVDDYYHFWGQYSQTQVAQVDQYGTLRNLSTASTRSILCPGCSAQEEKNHKSYLVERYEVAKCHQLLLGETYEESEVQSAVIQGCILKPVPFCPMVGDAIYPTMTMNSVIVWRFNGSRFGFNYFPEIWVHFTVIFYPCSYTGRAHKRCWRLLIGNFKSSSTLVSVLSVEDSRYNQSSRVLISQSWMKSYLEQDMQRRIV